MNTLVGPDGTRPDRRRTVIRFVESVEKRAERRRADTASGSRGSKIRSLSPIITDCPIVLWFKVHSSPLLGLSLQQQQTLEPVFSLCREFMAGSEFPRAYKIGKHSWARVARLAESGLPAATKSGSPAASFPRREGTSDANSGKSLRAKNLKSAVSSTGDS